MSKIFSYISKIILNPIVLGILFIVSVLGGGLGSALGLGFISAPFAYISIPSETLYVFEGSLLSTLSIFPVAILVSKDKIFLAYFSASSSV